MERCCDASVYMGQLSVMVMREEVTEEKANVLMQGMLGDLTKESEEKDPANFLEIESEASELQDEKKDPSPA